MGDLIVAGAIVVGAIITAWTTFYVVKYKSKTRSEINAYTTKPNNSEIESGHNLFKNGPENVINILMKALKKRIADQLDKDVRRYETIEAVKDGCVKLANKIKKDKFKPEIIIGWRDRDNTYQGSTNIAKLLSTELNVKMKIILLEEYEEKRTVVDDCSWIKNKKRVLLVDDACYSGNTCKEIEHKLIKNNKNLDVRCAMLSASDPKTLDKLYFVSLHKTDELLFPWGWSRKILELYNIYHVLGIQDRYTVWKSNNEWGDLVTIAKNFTGRIEVVKINSNKKIESRMQNASDVFIYILKGPVYISIGEKSGKFNTNQFIFIPRSINYVLYAKKNNVLILNLLSMRSQINNINDSSQNSEVSV